MKEKIDGCADNWENIKHDINPLELVFTFVKGKSVSKITPVSRAFFKMIEILKIIGELPSNPIRTLHLAEAPGGFIQALNWKRRGSGIIDESVGWSIEKENAWRKLYEISRTWTFKPELKLGNLLDKNVRREIVEHYRTEKAFIVTGDGGFDFSDDYGNQETSALELIIAQFVVGIQCIQRGGVFVLKVFDCFTLPTIQIMWVFWRVFGAFRVVKLRTSRACNSEKYIIARNFKGEGDNLRKFIDDCEKFLDMPDKNIKSLINEGSARSYETMEKEFTDKFNSVIGDMIDKQTEWIFRAVNGYQIPNEDKTRLAIEWCKEHSIPINPDYFKIHPNLKTKEESDWQEHYQHFSLRRHLSSVSPVLSD